MNLLTQIRSLFEPALTALAPDKAKLPDLLAAIKPSNDPAADYQANFAMSLGKVLKVPAREAAQLVVSKLPTDIIEPPTVAGPKPEVSFIILRLKPDFLAKAVQGLATDPKLGVPACAKPRTFV